MVPTRTQNLKFFFFALVVYAAQISHVQSQLTTTVVPIPTRFTQGPTLPAAPNPPVGSGNTTLRPAQPSGVVGPDPTVRPASGTAARNFVTTISGKRSILLRNSKIDLPVTIDVIAGIRCLDDDPQCPYPDKVGYGAHELSALAIVIEDIRNNSEWSAFYDMKIRITDSNGIELNSIGAVADATMDNTSLAIIGPQDTCIYEPGIAAVDNRFILSYRCGGRQLGDGSQQGGGSGAQGGTDYSSFAQLRSAFSDIAHAVVDFIKSYKWERAVILHFTDNSVSSIANLDTMSKSLLASEISIMQIYTIDIRVLENVIPTTNVARSKYLQILAETFLDTRVYVLMSALPGAPEALFFSDLMARMGLLQTGEYANVIIPASAYGYLYDGSSITADIWLKYPLSPSKPFPLMRRPSLSEIFLYYRSAAYVIESPPVVTSASWKSFQTRIRAVMQNPPCPLLCNISIQPFPQPYPDGYVSFETGLLYDALMTYVVAINEVILANVTDPHKGDVMVQQYGERIINSITGLDIFVDSFGDPIGNITVLTAMQPNTIQQGLYPAAQFWLNVTEDGVSWALHYFYEPKMNWLNKVVPPHQPRCGWKGDGCPSWKDYTIPIVVVGVSVVSVLAIVTLTLVLRQWKYERQLQSLFWKIESDDLTLENLQEHLTSMRNLGSATMGSIRSQASLNLQKSHISLRDYERNLLQEIKHNKIAERAAKDLEKRNTNKFGFSLLGEKSQRKAPKADEQQKKMWKELENFGIASFKGRYVGLKRIYKAGVEFNRAIRKELKFMMDLRHDNLNCLEGLIYEPPIVFMVTELRHRGCLKDILENEEIQIDSMFLASMIHDLIKGLSYLHHGPLRCHGKLKSTNCLLDIRWVLRVSGFDMVNLRQDEERPLQEEDKCRKLLWTAPELLRDPVARIKGTPKGDIYALGIILHEMYGRRGPFGDELLNPVDVIHQVTNYKPGQAPYRPEMTVLEGVPGYIELVMQSCWEESPEGRPTIDAVRKKLQPLTKGLKSSAMENVISMMERYSTNLENIVADRTNQLQEEKKKTERLLLQMLPKSVAEALKHGQSVDPERYDCATLYFSDIAGFTAMSSESTPEQVVTFLNDLYTCFDAIISMYDVYKVETIGDAYMVVSGLPIRNGDNHAGEIASMSLSLLDAVNLAQNSFFTRVLSVGTFFQTDISIFTGSRMPRYCLFGETVHKASRMEQSGQALKIHCSSECKELLDRLKGYEIMQRGVVELKAGEEEKTYWVVNEDLELRRGRLQVESLKYPTLKKQKR